MIVVNVYYCTLSRYLSTDVTHVQIVARSGKTRLLLSCSTGPAICLSLLNLHIEVRKKCTKDSLGEEAYPGLLAISVCLEITQASVPVIVVAIHTLHGRF